MPGKTIHLTAAAVKRAACRAYEEGRLQAQNPNPSVLSCQYRLFDGQVCGIGAAMPDEFLSFLSYENVLNEDEELISGNASTIRNLIERGYVTTDDRTALEAIQDLHDTWCFNVRLKRGEERIAESKEKFLHLIHS